MSPHTTRHIARGILIGAGGTILAALLMGFYGHVQSEFTDALGAKADTTEVRAITTKLDAIGTKVDSANFRLTQIQCGRKVDLGCR